MLKNAFNFHFSRFGLLYKERFLLLFFRRQGHADIIFEIEQIVKRLFC